jgi:hypothetical protein
VNDRQATGMLRQEIALMNHLGTHAPQLVCFLDTPTALYVRYFEARIFI